ncbi:MAG: hypothetical protein AB7S75_08330 [Desulfococcaceae bacterium]
MTDSHVTLKKDDEKARIPDKQILVTLSWSAPVDLDLMAFYCTKDGRTGGIFSDNYEGGSMGTLEVFPFIRLSGDAGIAADKGKKEESLQIIRLNDMKEIFFCVVNFSDFLKGENTPFGSFDAQILISDGKNRPVAVPLDSEKSGIAAVIAKIDNTAFTGPKLVKVNRVMDMQTFQQTVPGAGVFQPASKTESLKTQDKTAEEFSEKETKPESTDSEIQESTDVSEVDIQTEPKTGEISSIQDKEKEKLFLTGLLSMMYLFIKDNDMDKDQRLLENAWEKGILKEEILRRVKIHPAFLDMLDKTEIFQSCYETVVSAYRENRLSESLFISALKNTAKLSSEEDRRHLIDMILIMAFADKVITEKEKEAMGQLIRHLGIRQELFDEMFTEKEKKVADELRQKKKKTAVKMTVAACCVLLLAVGSVFLFSGRQKDESSDKQISQHQAVAEKVTDTLISVNFVSADVSRENKKNVFPLRKLFPFTADLTFEANGMTEEKRKKFCELLTISSDSFVLKKCTVAGYEGNRLRIEVEAESKNAGEKILSFAVKANPDFDLKGNREISLIVQERITDCSQFLEDRYDSAKEYESGQQFAECVNDWMITPELQENTTALLDSERVIPQHDYDLFLSNFIRSENKPKNPFNWFLGVLSVKPEENYEPYLAVFQTACLKYLMKITSSDSPLIAYFAGMNPNISSQYEKILKNRELINCAGIEEIGETDFLRLKRIVIEKYPIGKQLNFKGNWKENKNNYTFENSRELTRQDNSIAKPVLVFNHPELLKNQPKGNIYIVTDTFRLDSDLCVKTYPHYPQHSIGFMMDVSKDDFCDEWITGYNFNNLIKLRKYINEESDSMTNFLYNKLMNDYRSIVTPYSHLNGEIHLLGLADHENGHLFLRYLNKTRMEKGQVNINFEDLKLRFLSPGGFLIYAYDTENKKFGVILDLSQPEFENGYVKSHGNFFPLD